MTLHICTTCPRYDALHQGDFAQSLHDEVEAAHLAPRYIACLGGCPTDGVVSLDAPGKTRIRFGHLTVADLPDLVRAAQAYDATETGELAHLSLPASLTSRITSVRPKLVRPATATPADQK
ncbi:DUF1636 family protein [Granulicoccus phenolivorans]|uniref:DUF1636 family protein n=1 Tax=Granulicoccus phenolivorans TaxID=266854 RepID=UPI0003F8CD98|nr:DUF1636 family protein [Granulicoccus phenolivorans]